LNLSITRSPCLWVEDFLKFTKKFPSALVNPANQFGFIEEASVTKYLGTGTHSGKASFSDGVLYSE